RLRRRAIVVLLTDFADTVSAETLVRNLGQLSRRHLVIFVSVRDPALGTVVQREPGSLVELNESVLAEDVLRDRDVVMQRLRRHGVFCIDASPEEITVQLINRYLEVKRRGLA
ncbi:MAG: DUF58 domain-containing protein, partial [Myxococcota bacterium]|nr:DUF58 domain-containing protein [Myxococcota bacterium]